MEARKKRAIDAVTPDFAKIVIENDKEDVIGQLLRGEYVDKRTPEEIEAEREREVEEERQKFIRMKTELQTGYWSDGYKMTPVQITRRWQRYEHYYKFLIEDYGHLEWLDDWDKANFKYIADDEKKCFDETKKRLQTGYWAENDPMNDVRTMKMQRRYNDILKLIIELGYTDWLDEWDEQNIKNVE